MKHPDLAVTGDIMPRAFHLMAKPTGAVCNLDCTYCYFLSKETLYPGSHFRMAEELQMTYIRQLFEAHGDAPEVVISWQGGEPTLMGLPFFRRAVELQRSWARPGQRLLNTMQTNGSLLDDEWCEFLKENDFLVGISIDGPRELHDKYRVDKGGKPTFDRAIRGLTLLREHGVDWNVLTTVHAANGDSGLTVYRFLRDELGAEFIQFVPVVERATERTIDVANQGWSREASGRPLYTQEGELVTKRSIGASQYGTFLIEVFEEWVRHDIGSVYVQMFDTALAHWAGMPGGLCVHEKTCGLQPALEHTGDVYSCDHFVEPRFLLGNIQQTHLLKLIHSEQQVEFGDHKYTSLTRFCLDCDVRFACNGGCPKDRFATSPYGESGQNYLCPSYKLFFRHVDHPMRKMAELLAMKQPPSLLMRAYESEGAEPRPRQLRS